LIFRVTQFSDIMHGTGHAGMRSVAEHEHTV